MIGYAKDQNTVYCVKCGVGRGFIPIKRFDVWEDIRCSACGKVVLAAQELKEQPKINRFTNKATQWFTPGYIRTKIHEYFPNGFLDPATSTSNPLRAARFFTRQDDGLSRVWDQDTFVNPPYGESAGFPVWVDKIVCESLNKHPIIALLPCGARFSTAYFQPLLKRTNAVCFIDHRVKFERADGSVEGTSMYDSAIYGFNVDPERFAWVFCSLGVVWRIT